MMMNHRTTIRASFQIYNHNLKLQRGFKTKIQLGYHTIIGNFPKTTRRKYVNLWSTYFKQWQVMSQEFGKIHIVDRT